MISSETIYYEGGRIHFENGEHYEIGKTDEHPTGLLGIGKPPGGDVAPEEEESLKALLGLAASSIANAQAHSETRRFNQELNEKIQELRALLDSVHGLTRHLNRTKWRGSLF